MNIGLFPGTFDPVHNGHITFARAAISRASLDKVIIVAEKEPYRKKPVAAWDHRQAMIERATESIESVDHDYQFAAQLSYQHTMKDMLSNARTHYGAANSFWFLVGSDVFEHMHKWRDVVHSSEYGGFIVALRDNHTLEWVLQKKALMNLDEQQIIIIDNENPHTSSSQIRSNTARGEVSSTVDPKVTEYIQTHKLYIKH